MPITNLEEHKSKNMFLVTFLKNSYVFLEIYMEQDTKILKYLVLFQNIYALIHQILIGSIKETVILRKEVLSKEKLGTLLNMSYNE